MILSDTSIHLALDEGRLAIEPEPLPRIERHDARSRPYDRSAVDLHLGPQLRVPRTGIGYSVDFRAGSVSQTLSTLYDVRTIPDEGFVLEPNRFILGSTEERVRLPLPEEIDAAFRSKGCLAARVEGKSSRARFGLLVHFTAPTIHAGFEGHITLEMMNLGPASIVLTAGMAICQLIVEEVDGIPSGPPSQFAGQIDPAGT